MKKMIMMLSACACMLAGTNSAFAQQKEKAELPKVYFFKEISSDNMVKIYEALGRKAEGKVAVKLSTGEPGNNYHLDPSLIKALVKKVNGTIVECNTAYGGGRTNVKDNLKAAEELLEL